MRSFTSAFMIIFLFKFAFTANQAFNFTKIVLQEKPLTEVFAEYIKTFNKTYTVESEEGLMRLQQLERSIKLLLEWNPDSPYTIGINKFSDFTRPEARALLGLSYSGTKSSNARFLDGSSFFMDISEQQIGLPNQNTTFKTSNWSYLFLPARDQGTCGCCWSFSTASLIESRAAKKFNIAPFYLSTQKSLSCDTTNSGCNGGWYGNSLPYIQSIGGLPLDSDYPFAGSQTPCSNSSTPSRYSIFTNISYCTNMNPNMPCNDSIIAGFLESGPVAVSVDGSQLMMAYNSGIYTGACNTMNHAVVLVGFGYDIVTNLYFFIIRNTWGATWGENGYIRIAKNETNNLSCFVTHSAFIVNY